MKQLTERIINTKYGWLLLLLLLAGINILASLFYTRIDLTEEKRYTLSKATRNLVRSLDDKVEIDVFLKGDFPAGFRRLAGSTEDFLQLLKDQNGAKVQYRFISPTDNVPGTATLYGDTLTALGAVPINLTVQKEAGQSSNIIFPAALVRYNGKETLVNLYPGASGQISQVEINSAEALMEYQFAHALNKLVQEKQPGIAYSAGNGEPTDQRTYDLSLSLRQEYQFGMIDLNKEGSIPADVDLLLVVKPQIAFTEYEKLKIDQFVMRGGKLLCFIDNLYAEQDSLAFKPQTIAFDRNLNLTDLFFRYGLRINTDLIMDLQCDRIPFVVGGNSDNPQYEFLGWNYYPLLTPAAGGTFTSRLGYVAGRFVNSIDTIKAEGLKKTPLLASSANSRIISTPALISLNENKNVPQDEKFKQQAIPAAMLLEGKFSSLYRNRISRAQSDSLNAQGTPFSAASVDNKIIVVADGDMVLNDFLPPAVPGEPPVPLPMGWNRYTYGEYEKQSQYGKLFIPVANRDFLLSCVEYLVSDPTISQTKNKDIVLRLLDSQKVKKGKTTWQLISIALPVLLVILAGWVYQEVRKRKYAS
ncbi:MAG TPA: gliding motility-associated ABC transporter substrate-binding protein GldG [Chitinophagaceae bacterium]|mgnify:CR=1 FL=1|nr:gliding motility-associated ABC transporter substrate-binding protein GldG [Chitinophagaceae bacterium]